MQSITTSVLQTPADLTAEWLSTALGSGPVAEFGVERIGTGQMSECYRVTLGYAGADPGPASVVLKVAASDVSSRQTGLAMGLYEREVRFYTDVAPKLPADSGMPVAPCFHAGFDPQTGAFHLLLGDAAPATVGDEIRGATPGQARLALTELGRVHRSLAGASGLADAPWLNRESPVNQTLVAQLYAGFAERYADQIAPEHRRVCERLVGSFDEYLAGEGASGRPQGLVHGDYRLDNMLFGEPGADRSLTVVDWQTVTWGPAMTDVAYFIGCALPTADRREHYNALLHAYHDASGQHLTIDEVRDGVRRQSFFGVLMAIVSPMLVERTERGDQMFMAMLQRHCDHVLDTDALAILPAPTTPEPLRPEAADEGPHPPTDEALFNESWYFDFADPGQGIGGWVRIGLMPNQGIAWINALVCGPDLPTVALLEWQAPLPDDPAELRTDAIELAHGVTEPLQSYWVTVRGTGQEYDNPAALLHAEAGRSVEAGFDLTWSTAGAPYLYRISPRYEVPCTVSGTVRIGDREFVLDAVPGQRDHSWAARDWWGMNWVWSAIHLDDGTHLHGVDIRIPDMPPLGVGYLQEPGRPLVELQTVTARAEYADNGLPVSTTLSLDPGDVAVDVEICGHAPVRLVSPEGKVSEFPRAWVAARTADGRRGVGWVEWNRVQP